MLTLPTLFVLSLAAWFASMAITLLAVASYARAKKLAASDLTTARAAYNSWRKSIVFGLATMARVAPASFLLATMSTGLKPAQAGFPAIMVFLFIVTVATVAMIFDLRLQDLLRPTPSDAAAAGLDDAITFDLTGDDLWRGQWIWQFRSRAGRLVLAVTLPLFVLILVALPLLTHAVTPRTPLAVDILAMIIPLGIVGAITVLFGKKLYLATLASRPGILGEHTIEIRADGLRERTHANDTLWRWSDVREPMETEDYLLIRVRAMGLFVIPKRAFASPDRASRFVNAVRVRMGGGGAGTPIPA